MPLVGTPLGDYCGGPASLCESVKLDCSKCNSVNKELAEKRQKEGRKIKRSREK